jgi:GDP-4-dehydro-6-deoxy-D-mannose reductase
MRLLVTGADGFVGKHAVREFRKRGDEVVELFGSPSSVSPSSQTVDVRDARAVSDAIAWAKPEGVLHLAGASSVARSHENPGEAFEVNAIGTVNLLDAVHRAAPKARMLVVSSGEVYGDVDHAAKERDPTTPTSPYAASKVAAEIAVKQFHASYGVATIIARPFNHLGRGQAPHFVVPSFARQIQAIRASGKGEIRVGNLEAVRDFSHVLDVVDAYRLLLESGTPGETYNVASGTGRSIRSLLDELIALAGVDVTPIIDPDRVRPVEIPVLVGDATKLRGLGWKPTRTVTDALREALAEASPT